MTFRTLTVAICCAFAALPLAAQEAERPQTAADWQAAAKASLADRLAQSMNTNRAKNVILFIGDGMGVSTVTAARIAAGQARGSTGEEFSLSFESFPHAGLVKTYNTNAQVADSAGTATAMMTGTKTNIGVINMAPEQTPRQCDGPAAGTLVSLAERVETSGRATGVVTTARLTHATPATVYANSPSRDWESDSDMPAAARAAGCVDIAAQLLAFPGNGLEVAMGGGRTNFLPASAGDPEYPDREGRRSDGRDLTAEWRARYDNAGYVTTADELASLDIESTEHLLGLYEPSHMQYEADRAEDAGGEPSLAEMTQAAVDILGRDEDGFFLMVEGGRIDHAHHGGNAYRALTDTRAFADAVAVAVAAVDLSETLILVTADHSHVFTIAGYPPRGNPIFGLVNRIAPDGSATREPVLAGDGKPYTTLGYWNGPGGYEGARPAPDSDAVRAPDYRQQAAVPRGSETHAGEDVPLYATGPWAHLANGVSEQNLLYHIMAHAMGLEGAAE